MALGDMAPSWGGGTGQAAPGIGGPNQRITPSPDPAPPRVGSGPSVYPGGPEVLNPPGSQQNPINPGVGIHPGYAPPGSQQNPVNPGVGIQPGYPNATSGPPPYAGYGGGAPPAGVISTNPLQPNPSEIAALGPANVQQFGGTPQVGPTYAQAAQQQYATGTAQQVNPNQNLAYMNYYGQLLNQGLQPQFQSQDQQMADQLAARGLTSSGTGQYLTNQLYGQQAAALAQGLQPIVSQGYGYTQQDIQGNQAAANQFGLANLGYANQAYGTNAAYQQQANMANAGASNAANTLNAQLYNQDRYANYGAYNQFMNELLGLGSGQLSADQAAYLNSFGPSTGVESAYGNALSGMQNTYGSVYGNALSNQNAQMQQAAMLAAMG